MKAGRPENSGNSTYKLVVYFEGQDNKPAMEFSIDPSRSKRDKRASNPDRELTELKRLFDVKYKNMASLKSAYIYEAAYHGSKLYTWVKHFKNWYSEAMVKEMFAKIPVRQSSNNTTTAVNTAPSRYTAQVYFSDQGMLIRKAKKEKGVNIFKIQSQVFFSPRGEHDLTKCINSLMDQVLLHEGIQSNQAIVYEQLHVTNPKANKRDSAKVGYIKISQGEASNGETIAIADWQPQRAYQSAYKGIGMVSGVKTMLLLFVSLLFLAACSSPKSRMDKVESFCTNCEVLYRSSPEGHHQQEILFLKDTISKELVYVHLGGNNQISSLKRIDFSCD